MGLYDRDYMQESPGWREDARRTRPVEGGVGVSASTVLMAVNVVVFLVQASGGPAAEAVTGLGVMQPDAVVHGQLWRLLTATYLHASTGHLFANMLGLYFFGPPLEAVWGLWRFLLVYTLGGIAGNVVLTLAGEAGLLSPYTLGLGASGSVLTILGAVAVLYPQARVYVYFLVPLRLRTFAMLYGTWFVFNIVAHGRNFGGDICHLVGLVLGAGYAWLRGPEEDRG
jgi:membrane associated rhomboid family serine protease